MAYCCPEGERLWAARSAAADADYRAYVAAENATMDLRAASAAYRVADDAYQAHRRTCATHGDEQEEPKDHGR